MIKNDILSLKTLSFLFVLFLVFNLTACSSASQSEENMREAKITIFAANNINPTENNTASPVVIKIFPLKNDSKFKSADFFSLYLNPKQTLGTDYLGQTEMMITPGETKTILLPFSINANYLSVLVAYQNINDATWYASKKITYSWGKAHLGIKLDNLSIKLD